MSPLTASRVLNGKTAGKVSARTRDHVLATAKAIGYRRNLAAAGLRLGRMHVIGYFTTSSTPTPWQGHQLVGAQQAAREAGYNLMLLGTAPGTDWRETVSEAIGSGQVDILILQIDPPPTVDDLRPFEGRVVLLNDAVPGVPSVMEAIRDGVREMMRHLISLGHRRIAYLAAPAHSGGRVRAYQGALHEAGLEPEPRYLAQADWALTASAAATQRLLGLDAPPTAIVCADDILAAGVYQAARDTGLAIPHDLSVASCYALSVAEILVPRLTALTSSAALAGTTAVQLGLALANGGPAPASKSLPMPLVVRESTASPR
ncbi:MAG: LacI family DNA-binding transcriptional regulator [Chloroflexi bacterium]|nr:LacI family DNA-binding transcriptional regulator [Chloroflexota bacterium]